MRSSDDQWSSLMDEQKRATFSKVNIHEDGTVQEYYTATVRKTHAFLAIVAIFLTIVISMFTIRSAVHAAIKEFVDRQCAEQLNVFHEVVHPQLIEEVGSMVDTKMLEHEKAAEAVYHDRTELLRRDITALTREVATLNEKAARNQRLLEQLLAERRNP